MHTRHDLTDEQWARLEPFLPDRTPQRGGRWIDHRQIIDGVMWRARAGNPWRDLPAGYGNWKTVYNRHRRWSGDGTWRMVLDELRADCDLVDDQEEMIVSVDSTVIRTGARATFLDGAGSWMSAGVRDSGLRCPVQLDPLAPDTAVVSDLSGYRFAEHTEAVRGAPVSR